MLACAASRMSRRASSGVRRTRLPVDTQAPLAIDNIVHNEYRPTSRSCQAAEGTPGVDRKNSRTLMGWPMSFWASMSQSHSTASSADDTATVLAVGALAATLAALCHETLG